MTLPVELAKETTLAAMSAKIPALSGGNTPVTVASSALPSGAATETTLSNVAAGAFVPRAPAKQACYVAPVTATSTHIDLTGTALATDIASGKTFLVVADTANVYYYWSTAISGDTVYDTYSGYTANTSGCQALGAWMQRYEKPAAGSVGLVLKGNTTGYLRLTPVT